MTDKLYTRNEIAARLKVSRSTTYRMEKAGAIKAVKIGRTKRFTDPVTK